MHQIDPSEIKAIKRKDEENLSEARSLTNSTLHAGIQGGETERRKEGYNEISKPNYAMSLPFSFSFSSFFLLLFLTFCCCHEKQYIWFYDPI